MKLLVNACIVIALVSGFVNYIISQEKKTVSGTLARNEQPQKPCAPLLQNARAVRNVQYKHVQGVDSRHLSLDIYASRDAKAQPVMVYLHGGGWSRGDKRAVYRKPQFFISQDYVFASVNYRLVPEGKHPNNIEDVVDAIVWIHDNIKSCGGDPDRIFLMGHSAGGHLAALASVYDIRYQHHKKDRLMIKGTIVIDMGMMDVTGSSNPRWARTFGSTPEMRADASPQHHIGKVKPIPPFLHVYNGEKTRKARRIEKFCAAVKARGFRAEMVPTRGQTHATINRDIGREGDKATAAILAFLNSLKKEFPSANGQSAEAQSVNDRPVKGQPGKGRSGGSPAIPSTLSEKQ